MAAFRRGELTMPYWRLSAFYLFYFALLGRWFPHWGLFLRARGFDAVAIGELMAILMATKIVAPNIWGWLGDHLGTPDADRAWPRWCRCWCSARCLWSRVLGDRPGNDLYSFFWNASLPQFEVITFTYLKDRVSAICAYPRLGLDRFYRDCRHPRRAGRASGPGGDPAVGAPDLRRNLVEFAAGARSGSGTASTGPAVAGHHPETAVDHRVFVAVFLMQVSHGPYYAFYSIFMQDHGYSGR